MEVCTPSDDVGLLRQLGATVGHHHLQFCKIAKTTIRNHLIQKWPQFLSRLQLWRISRLKYKMYPFGHNKLTGSMPSSSIQHQNNLAFRSDPDGLGKFTQHCTHPFTGDRGGDLPFSSTRCRMNKTKYIVPLVATFQGDFRALSYGAPYTSGDGNQPQSRLIFGPYLYIGFRMALYNCIDGFLEPPFLKASLASLSLPG